MCHRGALGGPPELAAPHTPLHDTTSTAGACHNSKADVQKTRRMKGVVAALGEGTITRGRGSTSPAQQSPPSTTTSRRRGAASATRRAGACPRRVPRALPPPWAVNAQGDESVGWRRRAVRRRRRCRRRRRRRLGGRRCSGGGDGLREGSPSLRPPRVPACRAAPRRRRRRGGGALRDGCRCEPSVTLRQFDDQGRSGLERTHKYCGFVAQLASPGAPAPAPPSAFARDGLPPSSGRDDVDFEELVEGLRHLLHVDPEVTCALRRDAAGGGGGVGGGLRRLHHAASSDDHAEDPSTRFPRHADPRGYRGAGERSPSRGSQRPSTV